MKGSASLELGNLILNGQPRKRQTVRMLEFCSACSGTKEPFEHARIPTFNSTFGVRIEMQAALLPWQSCMSSLQNLMKLLPNHIMV